MACRLASSFRQRLGSPLSQPGRPTFGERFMWPRWSADKKTMLHLGDDLAGDFQLSHHAVDTVGVQPDDRLGDDGRRVQLIRNRNPVVALEAPFREPATHFAPRRGFVGALAVDPPAQARSAPTSWIVIDADDAQMLELPARESEEQAVDRRLVLRQVNGQEQWRERIGDRPVGAFWPARMIDDRRRDRGKAVDELRCEDTAAVCELLPAEAIDREAQHMRLVFLAGPHAGIVARVRRRWANAAPRPFGGLVTGVAPALVVIGHGPAAIEVPPNG